MHPVRKFFSPIVKPPLQYYLREKRSYTYKNISLKILPGVFHPGLFFSTKFLLSHLESFDLEGKSLLELGAGSGLIAFWAEKRGAEVTASDFSQDAINGLKVNQKNLGSHLTIYHSDLFEQIPQQSFDYIVINPPYYPKKITEEWQLAWYCGEHFDYFRKLFSQLATYSRPDGKVFMVLSEDCDIFTIFNLAQQHDWRLIGQKKKRFWWEWNTIFECCRKKK